MSFLGTEKIEPTLYDPKIHGKMSAEERKEYNRKLLASIPERNSEDMTHRFYYNTLIEYGILTEAEQHKEGRDRDLAWETLDREIRSQLLYTKEEMRKIEKNKKAINKIDQKVEKETGINVGSFLEALDEGLTNSEQQVAHMTI